MSNSLTGKIGYISLGKFLASLSSLIAGAILSRYLDKDTYGTYRQLWLVYNTLYPVIALGIPTSVNYFIPQLPHKERKMLNTQTFTVLTFGGAILSGVFFLGAPLIATIFHNPSLIPVARLFALIPILTLPTLYYQNLFICLDRPILVAGLSAGLAFGRLLVVSIPLIMGYGLISVLIGLVVFSFAQFLIVTYLMFRPFGLRLSRWKFNLFFSQLRYAFPIGIASIVGTLTKQLDKIVISSFFAASQYAVYANGAIEIPLIGIITGSVTAVLMPEFVRLNAGGKPEHLVELWHSAIRKVALIILPVMVFLLIYAPEFLTLLFSAKYAESASVFRVYLLALPNRITTFGTILLAMGLSSLVLRYSLYTLILNIGLNYLLVKTIGFIGPAIGTVIAIYFIAFIQLRKIGSLMSVAWPSILPWNTLGRTAGVALVAGVASSWPKLFYPQHPGLLHLLYGGGTYGIVFLVIAIWSKILKKQDWKNLLREVLRTK